MLWRLTTGKLNTPIQTQIYVFNSDRGFTPYKPIRNGKPMEVDGLVIPRTEQLSQDILAEQAAQLEAIQQRLDSGADEGIIARRGP